MDRPPKQQATTESDDIFANFDKRIKQWRQRELELREYWAANHGPLPEPDDEPWDWPKGFRPPCSDCAHIYTHMNGLIGNVEAASTFFDAHEARYFVCERHWRRRMYSAGRSKASVREMLIEQGGFSPDEADAAIAEDADIPDVSIEPGED